MFTNLFDVAMVFAVALMVALVAHFNMSEIFSKEDYTIVKNPETENMEIIMKEGDKIKKYTPSDIDSAATGSKGHRLYARKRRNNQHPRIKHNQI